MQVKFKLPERLELVDEFPMSKVGKVSKLVLTQQIAEGIPFPIGRPEIVATDPAYRKQGLIRALFEMVHARSEAEGHPVQAITDIPYFYRQFGYEYGL